MFAKENNMENKRFNLSFEEGFDINELKENAAICITGTDTGIGKTVVTGLLAKELSRTTNVTTQKWVQSGDLDHPDIQTHDNLSGIKHSSNPSNNRQVYSFKTPASPHLAAKIEGKKIQSDVLISATENLMKTYDMILVETSGGILVPLNGTETTADVIFKMELPTIVVIPNKLGTINHSLLTINYLKLRNINILGFILNQMESGESIIHEDNPVVIQKFSQLRKIGTCQQI